MHARPQCRKDQLPLRSHRDLRYRWVLAPVQPRLAKWEYKRPQGAAGHERKWGHIRGTFYDFHHSYINGLIVFLQISRILQTGILQTGTNQFVESQKQNQDNTGRFSMKNLPKRLEFFLSKRVCRNVLFPVRRRWYFDASYTAQIRL